ncbi:MAG: YdbL family protein [Pseudomonadota bacterium]
MTLRSIALMLCALILIPVGSAHAMTLADAKQQGVVGEKADGLVGAINPPAPASVQAVISETNNGRLSLYREQAAAQGVTLSQYQAVAGAKLIAKTPTGQYVDTGSGWQKK